MAMPTDDTTILAKKTTRDRLKGYGQKGEPYDSILNRLMDVYDDNKE
jgi:hypothetical protein